MSFKYETKFPLKKADISVHSGFSDVSKIMELCDAEFLPQIFHFNWCGWGHNIGIFKALLVTVHNNFMLYLQ